MKVYVNGKGMNFCMCWMDVCFWVSLASFICVSVRADEVTRSETLSQTEELLFCFGFFFDGCER